MELSSLTWDEKVFFAGSLRAMILADGVVEDDEIAWVDRIRDEDRFDDMDQCLDEFSAKSEEVAGGPESGKPSSAYYTLAESITRSDARELILERLEAISNRDGYQKEAEAAFFTRLREVWGFS